MSVSERAESWNHALSVKPARGGWIIETDVLRYAVATSVDEVLEILRDLMVNGTYTPEGRVHQGTGDVAASTFAVSDLLNGFSRDVSQWSTAAPSPRSDNRPPFQQTPR